jgi:hypothetical protein
VNAKKLVQESIIAECVEVNFLETILSKTMADFKTNQQHSEENNQYIQPVSLFVDQFIQQKWILDTEKWDTSSNHSQSDLETVKSLLEEKLKNSSVDSSPPDIINKNKTYSPDLILKNQILSEEIFVELKVLNHASSHFFPIIHLNQLFRYSSISAACILVIYHSKEVEVNQILNQMDILAETKDCTVEDLLTHLRKRNERVKQQLMHASAEKQNIKDSLSKFYHFIRLTAKEQLEVHDLEIVDVLLQSYSSIQSSFSIGYLNKVIKTVNSTIFNLEKKPSNSKIRFTNLITSPLEFLIDEKESFIYRIGFLPFEK